MPILCMMIESVSAMIVMVLMITRKMLVPCFVTQFSGNDSALFESYHDIVRCSSEMSADGRSIIGNNSYLHMFLLCFGSSLW